MKIFAIGAHFDDVEIGCGGTLLRRAAEGDQIFILTVTNSEYSKPNGGPKRRGNVAKAEAQEAAKILGAELICLNKPCLDLIHNEELVYDIEDVVQEVKPDILLTHWGGDFHSDHVAVSLSSLRASRRTPTILSYRSNWYATEQVFKGSYYRACA